MGIYEQHMKHWGNHRKDRYYQQCSGYFGKSLDELRTEEESISVKYYIIDEANNIIKTAETWDGIIEAGKLIDNKDKYFIANSKMLMGRLDLNY